MAYRVFGNSKPHRFGVWVGASDLLASSAALFFADSVPLSVNLDIQISNFLPLTSNIKLSLIPLCVHQSMPDAHFR
jgi:hypothetical protein